MQYGRVNVDISTEFNHPIRGFHGVSKTSMFVFHHRVIRFFRVGRLLFVTAVAGIMLCCYFTGVLLRNTDAGEFTRLLVFLAAYSGGVLPLFALLDARSRFQDYKKAKDLFFKNGFKPRIANLFIHSKCQRDAVRIAARDLGIESRLNRYYLDKGYRWYHVLPNIALQRPGVFLTSGYWKKTLLAPHYSSKYFLW